MSDPHALTLDAGGQRLTFRCTYATLLRLEALGDWRADLADAIGFGRPSALIRIAALFCEQSEADLILLSPPIAETQRCIAGAWSLCMEGPEGLKRYQDAVAKEAAAEDAGKSGTSLLSLAAQSLKRFGLRFGPESAKTSSGA